jgi:ankyrin repeat protein
MANIDPAVRDRHQSTPLIFACHRGRTPIVRQLLARDDVDINACGNSFNGATPLIVACRKGHVEIINLLLAKDGIDINLLGTQGMTALIAAAQKGLVEVVESMLARDDLNPNIVDDFGRGAFECAACQGHADVMKLLLNHPRIVDLNLDKALNVGARFPDVVKLLLDQEDIDVNFQAKSGPTALSWAAYYNSVESAKLLLERGDINVNIPDNRGSTALHQACYQQSLGVVDLLLARHDIDPRFNRCSMYDVSPLLHRRTTSTYSNALDQTGIGILTHLYERGLIHNYYASEVKDLLRTAGVRR